MRDVMSQKGDRLGCGVDGNNRPALKTTLMPDAIEVASGVRQPLGRLLLECGKITQEQLEQALEVQRQIGPVLVRLGALDNSTLEDTLQSQLQHQKQKQSTPTPVAFRIGEILVASGHISREQLNESIEHQKNSDKKLGEILVEKGYVQQHLVDLVEHGIHLQQMLVTAALSAVVSISSLDREAEAGSSGGTSSATVHVSATVRPIAIAKVLYQQQQIEITSKDIAQGYVEIPNASRIEVRSNNHSGYLLSIENQGGPFRDVYVSGLGSEVQLNGGTGWVLMSYTQMPRTMDVSYRIMLSDDARPGSYPWPFQVSAMLI